MLIRSVWAVRLSVALPILWDRHGSSVTREPRWAVAVLVRPVITVTVAIALEGRREGVASSSAIELRRRRATGMLIRLILAVGPPITLPIRIDPCTVRGTYERWRLASGVAGFDRRRVTAAHEILETAASRVQETAELTLGNLAPICVRLVASDPLGREGLLRAIAELARQPTAETPLARSHSRLLGVLLIIATAAKRVGGHNDHQDCTSPHRLHDTSPLPWGARVVIPIDSDPAPRLEEPLGRERANAAGPQRGVISVVFFAAGLSRLANVSICDTLSNIGTVPGGPITAPEPSSTPPFAATSRLATSTRERPSAARQVSGLDGGAARGPQAAPHYCPRGVDEAAWRSRSTSSAASGREPQPANSTHR
jgi:hypothetical protein